MLLLLLADQIDSPGCLGSAINSPGYRYDDGDCRIDKHTDLHAKSARFAQTFKLVSSIRATLSLCLCLENGNELELNPKILALYLVQLVSWFLYLIFHYLQIVKSVVVVVSVIDSRAAQVRWLDGWIVGEDSQTVCVRLFQDREEVCLALNASVYVIL